MPYFGMTNHLPVSISGYCAFDECSSFVGIGRGCSIVIVLGEGRLNPVASIAAICTWLWKYAVTKDTSSLFLW